MCKHDQNPAEHQEEILLMAKEEVLIWGSFQKNHFNYKEGITVTLPIQN